MYNAVEFKRVRHELNEYDDGPVYIVPRHVVKVSQEPTQRGEIVNSRIDSVTGETEIVEGPPSEVNARLRKGQ